MVLQDEANQNTEKEQLANERSIRDFEKLTHILGNPKTMCRAACMHRKDLSSAYPLISSLPWGSAQAENKG